MVLRLILFIAAICSEPVVFGGVRDINGSSSLTTLSQNQVFPKGTSTVRGLVAFNAGITVAEQATVVMDSVMTVSGGLDVRTTGTFELHNDLYLAPYFTFSTSNFTWGAIKGNGNTIFLNGPLTIQQDKSIKFIGDTIIDGQGNDIVFGPHAQLYVDHGITLTLKNTRCVVQRNTISRPALKLTSLTSQLALMHTDLVLGEDFAFDTGKLFIHGDVHVTSTSIFQYQSTKTTYIDRQSSLLFEGATYHHIPRTGSGNQFYMKDKTSILAFENATVLTTHTGMRLTRGNLQLDNTVTMSSASLSKFSSLSLLNSVAETDITFIDDIKWSNDGRYILVYGKAGSNWALKVLKFTGSTFVSAALTTVSIPGDDTARDQTTTHWSPDGNYIVLGGNDNSSNDVQVYRFNGAALTLVSSVNITGSLGQVECARWHPSGKYLLLASSEGNYGVASFVEGKLTLLDSGTASGFNNCYQCAWSRDGLYAALGGHAPGGDPDNGALAVYQFNGSSLSLVGSSFIDTNYFGYCGDIFWSFDNNYIATGGHNYFKNSNGSVTYFSFDGSTLTGLDYSSEPVLDVVRTGAWSTYEGLIFFAIGNQLFGSSYGTKICPYELNNGQMSSLGTITLSDFYNGLTGCVGDFIPNGKLFVVGGTNIAGSAEQISLYQVNYGEETGYQSYTSGIGFGKSTSGSAADLNIVPGNGAEISMQGKVLYDNT